MPRRKKKVNNTPIEVGDYVKIGLSGMGSEAYVVEEIHYKENKDGIVLDAEEKPVVANYTVVLTCLLYTSPSPRDRQKSRMPSSA